MEQALMNEIEQAAELPSKSSPIQNYGRYYAVKDKDRIIAVYLLPAVKSDPEDGCSTFDKHFNLRPCTTKEIAAIMESKAQRDAYYLRAGERRWYATANELPHRADGGCSIVTIEYDPQTRRFLRIECNDEG
jgi:hypothetical protein